MPTYSWSDTLSGISADPPKGSKLALVILTELSSILYSGTVFGWAPILLVLRDEGLFADICEGEDNAWCDARKEKLGFIFTFAAVIYSASGVFVGAWIDKFGPAACIVLACVTSCIGFYMFGMYLGPYMLPNASEYFPIVGYSLIGIGGMAFFQAAFKAQYAWPYRDEKGRQKYYNQTLIIAGVTTLGDASVCMWLLFECLYMRWGISMSTIFMWYSLFTIVMSVALIALWIVNGPSILAAGAQDGAGDDSESLATAEAGSGADYGAIATKGRVGSNSATVPLQDRPFMEQIKTFEFVFVMVFAGIHVTRGNLFLGLLESFFDSPQFGADAATVSHFVNLTSALVPLGCLCAPIVDNIIERFGFATTSYAIALMGATYSLLMLSSSINLQIVTAVIFLVYRANLFAFPPAFAGRIFGPRTVGRVSGLMWTLMSPVQFILSPALHMTLTTFEGDFRPLQLMQLVAIAPVVILTYLLTRWSKEKSVGPPTPKIPRKGYVELPLVDPPLAPHGSGVGGTKAAAESRRMSIAI